MRHPDLFEEALSYDTDLVFSDPLSSAVDMQIMPDGSGDPLNFRGMFEAPGLDSSPPGISTGIVTAAPMLHVPARHIHAALGRPLSTRDLFLIRGKRYRPQAPHDDGFGLVSCKLLEAGNV